MPAEMKQQDIERRVRIVINELKRQHVELGYLMRDVFPDQKEYVESAFTNVSDAIQELKILQGMF